MEGKKHRVLELSGGAGESAEAVLYQLVLNQRISLLTQRYLETVVAMAATMLCNNHPLNTMLLTTFVLCLQICRLTVSWS